MAISVFPAGGDEFVTNDFVVDMNNSANNVVDLGRSYAAGAYDVSLASGDSTFDIYALDADGASVGYTSDATIVATAAFTSIVILGVSTTEVVTFAYAGASNNTTSEGDATGAGAYLESIVPFDLPNIDDSNFATDVEIYFESGTVSTAAKNVTRNDSTELIVTRPDSLDVNLDPWDVKALNPGVTAPTGSNAHILAGTVDAGATPVWTTTSPLDTATPNVAYSATVVATDPDGGTVDYAITAGTFPGLTLSSGGVLSGTPTAPGTATITASDEGGNGNPREFILPLIPATGGTVSEVDGYRVHTFNSSDDLIVDFEIATAELIILAGGGGSGKSGNDSGGGGGGGGLLSSISGFNSGSATSALASETLTPGTYTVTIGAGGAGAANNNVRGSSGSDTIFPTVGTAIGGGGGAGFNENAATGGSGGGAGGGNRASGTSGQGFSGGVQNAGGGSGGGGSFTEGAQTNTENPSNGGKGTHNFLDQRGWGAGGGGGRRTSANNSSGGGSSGNDQTTYAGNGSLNVGNSGVANFGGGGGSGISPGAGGSGKVVVRYQV